MKSGKTTIETSRQLIRRLQITFDNVALLSRALTHRSYLNEHPDALEDNERLEYLGDAVLDYLVAEWLYNRFPEMKEGALTQMRSAFVQTGQLASFAREIKIDNAIRLGRGELKSGGNLRNSLLCDVFEAFIGAMLLDQGIEQVKIFIYPLLESSIEEIISKRKNTDPKSLLQEWAQAKGYSPPKYHTINVTGPDHAKVFEVEARVNNIMVASGEAKSKQAAEKKAAQRALEIIQKENELHV